MKLYDSGRFGGEVGEDYVYAVGAGARHHAYVQRRFAIQTCPDGRPGATLTAQPELEQTA